MLYQITSTVKTHNEYTQYSNHKILPVHSSECHNIDTMHCTYHITNKLCYDLSNVFASMLNISELASFPRHGKINQYTSSRFLRNIYISN